MKLFGVKHANFDIAERNHAAVFLEEDIAIGPLAKIGDRVEFAFGDELAKFRRAALILQDFGPIQPMLDMFAFRNNQRVVPLADVIGLFILRSRDQIVERTKRAIAVAAEFRVRMPFVIEHLKFRAEGRADGGFGAGAGDGAQVRLHEIFNAAVAAGGGFEIHLEFEI